MILSKRESELIENGGKTLLVLPRDHGRRRHRYTDPVHPGVQVLDVERFDVGSVLAIHIEHRAIRHRAPTLASVDRRYREETVTQRELRCHVKVTNRFECLLHEISDQWVKALGFNERGDLYGWWRETFEAVEPPASTDPPATDYPCLVLQIQREEHRFPVKANSVVDPLHPAASDPAGYNDGPGGSMKDAGESPPKDVTDAYSMQADQTAHLAGGHRERERRETWELDARVRRVEELAKLQGTDVSPDMRVARHALARAERAVLKAEQKLGRRAA